MKVAVTGGAGFIGRPLVFRLAQSGHTVVVLDNLRRGAFGTFGNCPNIDEKLGDVRIPGDCVEAFEGCSVVLHLAAQANVMGTESDPDYAIQTNVLGTWNVGRAAVAAGVRHLVFTSSREVYGNVETLPVHEDHPLRPQNMYGASKVAGEAILAALRSIDFGVSIVRLSNVIGPGDRDRVVPNWLRAARTGEPLVMFGGNQELDLIPIDFVATVLARLAEGDPIPAPLNVGSGTTTRLPDLARHILEKTESRSHIDVRPPRGPEVTRFRADTSRLAQMFGVAPPTDPLAAIRAEW